MLKAYKISLLNVTPKKKTNRLTIDYCCQDFKIAILLKNIYFKLKKKF